MGAPAFEFVDLLHRAGVTLWQILPLGPLGLGNSPYAAHSAFAGNPLLISLEALVDDGLLTWDEVRATLVVPTPRVDYASAERIKFDLLRIAARRHRARGGEADPQYAAFCAENRDWLEDYALFAALSNAHHGVPWQRWPGGVAQRRPDALARARQLHAPAVELHTFAQFVFWSQWARLRSYANGRGIQLMGDIPIFVAAQSADVWAHPEMFFLNPRGNPEIVAGVPPDYFSRTGQRWGNPLYRWDVLEADGYAWWIARFKAMLRAVDLVRLDHFRGFAAYYEISARHRTAERGRWVLGPGIKLFDAVRRALPDLPMVVEDLGVITPDVVELREALGCPGMRVLQFAFDTDAENPYLPHNYEVNVVAYTGTHDNDTTLGWYRSASEHARHHLRRYLGVSGDDVAWDMIRAAFGSVAQRAIVPVQDVLGLGSEARMNLPGQPDGNWTWRLQPGQLNDRHATRLRDLVDVYGRAPAAP